MSDEQGGDIGSEVALQAGLALSDLTPEMLWLDYYGLGGSLTQAELMEALRGARRLSGLDHDRVALGLNEHFGGRGLGQPVPFAEELDITDRN